MKGPMTVPFVKAHACGNDFLIVDARHAPENLAEFTVRICDRHRGVGADGVEFVHADPQVDARIRLINADGSNAELSGNGTRCVAASLVAERGGAALTIRTDAGLKLCTLTARAGQHFEFETTMGQPEVGEPFTIRLASREVTGIPVSMGNPHFVVFVDRFDPRWQVEAAEIERHHDFKFGTNVELVHIKNKEDIDIRIFERGAGVTQSSGTGSCASAVASIHSGRAQSPLRVHAPGGVQTVQWDNKEVLLRGPAEIVCRGEFLL
jgi:diaminopimelate epimerase